MNCLPSYFTPFAHEVRKSQDWDLNLRLQNVRHRQIHFRQSYDDPLLVPVIHIEIHGYINQSKIKILGLFGAKTYGEI